MKGKRQGRGTFITSTINVFIFTHVAVSGNAYTGEYFNGKMHGKGVYTYNNGDRYEVHKHQLMTK